MVLKLTPDPKIAADEVAALDTWMDCRHVVTLHDADADCGALLLERMLPGTRVADEPGQWTLQEVLPVLAAIWQHRVWLGAGSELSQLRARAEFVFELTRRRLEQAPAVARFVPPDLVGASLDLAMTLAEEGPALLLHGDLHPGNILRGRGGLVAIDPRACVGDPAFDAVDWVLADGGGEQAIRQRIDWLAGRVAEIDPCRTWAWCQALAVVLAVGHLSRDSQDPLGGEMLAVARTVTTRR